VGYPSSAGHATKPARTSALRSRSRPDEGSWTRAYGLPALPLDPGTGVEPCEGSVKEAHVARWRECRRVAAKGVAN